MWEVVRPVEDPPSPNSQAYDAIVPSESVDPEPSNDASNPSVVDVNAAIGSAFCGGAVTVTAKMAKVYSPVTDLAMPMGRKPAAVMSVPVSIGLAVTS